MTAGIRTKAEMEAARATEAFEHPVVEMLRRFGAVDWCEHVSRNPEGEIVARAIDGRWKVKGNEHALRHPLPVQRLDTDVEEAKENIAKAAIYNDELRQRTQ